MGGAGMNEAKGGETIGGCMWLMCRPDPRLWKSGIAIANAMRSTVATGPCEPNLCRFDGLCQGSVMGIATIGSYQSADQSG